MESLRYRLRSAAKPYRCRPDCQNPWHGSATENDENGISLPTKYIEQLPPTFNTNSGDMVHRLPTTLPRLQSHRSQPWPAKPAFPGAEAVVANATGNPLDEDSIISLATGGCRIE